MDGPEKPVTRSTVAGEIRAALRDIDFDLNDIRRIGDRLPAPRPMARRNARVRADQAHENFDAAMRELNMELQGVPIDYTVATCRTLRH